jgi:hypothetical protein
LADSGLAGFEISSRDKRTFTMVMLTATAA